MPRRGASHAWSVASRGGACYSRSARCRRSASSFVSELPLQQTSLPRRLPTFGLLLAASCALACYQDKPAPAKERARTSATAALGLEPAPVTHDTAIREIDRTQLTTERLQRWAQANRNANALYARDPDVGLRLKGTSPPATIDAMAARIDGEPAMRNALRQGGMSARGYLLTMIALQQALHGYQLKQMGKLDAAKVPPIVLGNIDFVSTHLPQIMQAVGGPAALSLPAR